MANTNEVRIASSSELRANPNKYALEGYAALYGVRSNDLGGFKEVIAAGAFDKTLSVIQRGEQDCRCLFNHDQNVILGRTQNSTLALSSDSRGLKFRCALDRSNPKHQEIYALVSRGDVSECSFAFKTEPDGDFWDEDTDENGQRYTRRTLTNVSLFDCSVVCSPAYVGTQVDARALEHAQRKLRPYSATELEAIRQKLATQMNAKIARAENSLFEDGEDDDDDDERSIARVLAGATYDANAERACRVAKVLDEFKQDAVVKWLRGETEIGSGK